MRYLRLFIKFYKKISLPAALAAVCAAQLTAAGASVPTAAFADKYAAIVIDANSGRVLFADRADLRRYPASLTKMMTLYLLFDAMNSGRVRANTPIPISAYANGQPPTKLGLGAGKSIGAEEAAKALITKSANDIAVAIAEYLGGSERNFTRMMTLKARQLGMRNTNFANASGLPDAQNYSTARDLALLSLALRRHFPRQYALFSTTGFVHHGRLIRGHNRLVANMAGVDGIKTGYTRMSGFNLASSRRIGNKSIVGVVMGGKTSALRDSHMAGLLTRYMEKASGKKGFTIMPEQAPDDSVLLAQSERPKAAGRAASAAPAVEILTAASVPVPTLKAEQAFAAADTEADIADGGDPVVMAMAQKMEAGGDNFAALIGGEAEDEEEATAPQPSASASQSDRERDSAFLMMLASQEAGRSKPIAAAQALNESLADGVPIPAYKEHSVDNIITASLPASAAAVSAKAAKKSWAVQLGAQRSKKQAEQILHKTRGTMRRYYPAAEPYADRFVKRGAAHYRARYSGFPTKAVARGGCAKLKKAGYKCVILAE